LHQKDPLFVPESEVRTLDRDEYIEIGWRSINSPQLGWETSLKVSTLIPKM